jgi:hypothetical protein
VVGARVARVDPPAAYVGPLRASTALEFRGNGVRDVRCPACTVPLAMHTYMDGDYLRTMPSKHVVRLPDGSYGKSKTGEIGSGPRAVVLTLAIRPFIDIHCITKACGGRLVRVDYRGAVR